MLKKLAFKLSIGSMFVVCLLIHSQEKRADLTMTVTHTGPFAQGDDKSKGDYYSLTVRNLGAANSTGTVLVTDSLPPGMNAISMTGAGWTCRLDSLTCVRSDSLPAPNFYSPIYLFVSISETAQPSVSNTAYLADNDEVSIAHRTISEQTDIGVKAGSSSGDLCSEIQQNAHANGYNVLTYYARSGVTAWKGIRRDTTQSTGVGLFMPTVRTKDQVMVEVCGLRFDTAVNITLASIAIPEAGADIRGSTPTATTTSVIPGSTIDALQTAGNATNSAIAATLPSTAQPSGLSANSILTLGSIKAGAYSGATIQATAEDFARAIATYQKETQVTIQTLRKLCTGQDDTCPAIDKLPAKSNDNEFQTISGAYAGAKKLRQELLELATNPQSDLDTGAFDEAKAKAQQFAVVLASLDSQISAANFGPRASTLAVNYRTVVANASTVKTIMTKDLKIIKAVPNCPLIPPTVVGPSAVQNKTQSVPAASPSDLLAAEYCNLAQFDDILETALKTKITTGGKAEIIQDNTPIYDPASLYTELSNLRNDLEAIDVEVSASFDILNQWYERSTVVYADILTPSTTNIVTRIGINATETFVPFTLSYPATSSSTSSGSASAPVAATTGHFESSTPIVVERIVHMNLVGGALLIHVPTTAFTFTQSTVMPPTSGTTYAPCGGKSMVSIPTGTPPTYYCSVPAINNFQVAGFAAVNVIPFGRNYFPQFSQSWKPKNLRGVFGIMIGSSVTSLGSGFGGLSLEPVNGVVFYGGVASAHNQTLLNGVGSGSNSNVFLSATQTPTNSLSYGFAFGVGMDLSVFAQIFKSTSAPSAP
jgi:hypothetical protein